MSSITHTASSPKSMASGAINYDASLQTPRVPFKTSLLICASVAAVAIVALKLLH
ncbi:MAG: hypothetical protein WAN79_01745 [Opitutaceae bacterium]|jgi:hypothetical protein